MDKKSIYLCTSFEELQKMSEMKKHEFKNVNMACKLLEKLFETFEKNYLDQDEELAYIYIMRFLSLFAETRKLFNKDTTYINAIINAKKIDQAFDKANNLKNSLKCRYEETKKNAENLNEPVEAVNMMPKDKISVIDLYKTVRSVSSVLIVDIRPRNEFLNCHINYNKLINIPANELNLGCSIVEVNKLIEKANDSGELDLWNKRQSFDLVVLVGWENSDADHIDLLKDAIYKWDANHSIKELVVLQGGLQSFSTHYPTMVTNSMYRGPETSKVESIVPEDIKYPDWNHIEAEKKRRKQIKILEEQKKTLTEQHNKINENDLEQELSPKPVSGSHIPVNRALKPIELINTEPTEDLKTSLSINRSLKPQDYSAGSLTQDRIIDPNSNIDKAVIKPAISKLIDKPFSDLESEKSKVTIVDRSLKPTILRALNIDNTQLKFDFKNDLENTDPSFAISSSRSEISRLSNNSRTTQDRPDFTAKGGAKSISPPQDMAKSTTSELPPWIKEDIDPNTNELYYVDYRNKKRYRKLPDSLLEVSNKENVVTSDHIESLKDFSNTAKVVAKTSVGSGLKRSTSQPNLSEDLNVPHQQPASSDNTLATQSSRQTNQLSLSRTHKPSPNKTFSDFSASRLNNLNPSYRTVCPGLTGLRNMGNTCYLNSVVQALSNTKFLNSYIISNSYRHDINRKNPLGYGGEIVTEFAFLIFALWTGNYREVSPSDFKQMIDGKNEMFRGSEQHDSQEFLLFLLDGLHEDLNRGSKQLNLKIPSADEQQNDSDRAEIAWKAHIAVNDSVIVRIFQGQYRSKVTCDHCQKSSVTFDAFMYLSLPLVPNHNRCTLEDCLKLFLSEEQMTGGSQWFCPQCKTNRNAKKKIDIWKLPPYLLIHLKRFSCTGQYRQKLNTFVDFPMESLSLVNILKHTQEKQKHENYHLYAVSNHHGNMESGHYTSFCKNVNENEWYNYDDDVVTKVRDSEVKSPSAYILFYESYNLKQAGYKN